MSSAGQQSLPERLCLSTLEAVVAAGSLTEVGANGPWRLLTSPMTPQPVGRVRIFRGDKGIAKAVYVGLTVAAIGLDSHMIFAFTPADSAVPHFTLDSVYGQGSFAFHLDLIPRRDLGANLGYVDAVYSPLTETFELAGAHEGLTRANIGPRQRSVMSPWMVVHRASEEAFASIEGYVVAYREHWETLLAQGIPAEHAGSAEQLRARDAANRAILFSPEVDAVWKTIERLIGDQAEQIRLQLLDNSIPA